MATFRPFAYNPSLTSITGTQQVGDLAIGVTPQQYYSRALNPGLGGVKWFGGPDEDPGYVIATPFPAGNMPTPDGLNNGTIKFYRTPSKTDQNFVDLTSYVSNKEGGTGPFSNVTEAMNWLDDNGFWYSYVAGPASTNRILYWDIQNASSYSGTGTTITDLQGNANGTITGTITYTSGTPKYLTIEGGTAEYIYTGNLNPYLSPANTGTTQSAFMWIYPTSNGVICSEQGNLTPDGGWYDAQIQRSSSGNFLFALWPYSVNTPQITTSFVYPLNNWYYVGWTYSGSSLRAFVNGVAVGSANVSRQTPYNNGGNLPMYFNLGYPTATDIGNTTSGTFRLGAMHVYNVGLTAGAVYENYINTKPSYIPDVVASDLTLQLDVANPTSYSSGSTWNDVSGLGNNITLTGSPTYTNTSPAYLTFNGTSQYGTGSATNVVPQTSYTKSAWFYLNGYQDNNIVSGDGHFIYMGPGGSTQKIYCGHANWPLFTAYPSAATINLNTWYNVTLTFNTTDGMKLYINGVLDSTYTANKSAHSGSGTVNVATYSGGNLLNGRISKVYCYSRSLTDAEVLQNYNSDKSQFGL
jgi:hypothetical protein